jgi:hypothetical protein
MADPLTAEDRRALEWLRGGAPASFRGLERPVRAGLVRRGLVRMGYATSGTSVSATYSLSDEGRAALGPHPD